MTNYDLIRKKAEYLRKEYRQESPASIARALGITVIEMPMGTGRNAIKGLILKSSRCVTIVINSDLSDMVKPLILLHEIAHYILGHLKTSRAGTMSDRSFDYHRELTAAGIMENEANFLVADYMLDTEETLLAVHDYDIHTAAKMLRVPVEILDYKLRLLYQEKRLDRYTDFLSVHSDCLKNISAYDDDTSEFCV